MTVSELINKLKEHDLNKLVVFYSSKDSSLIEHDFLGTYENSGQVEIHVSEGEEL